MLKIACIAKNHHPGTLGGIETFERNLNKLLGKYNFRIYVYPIREKKSYFVNNLKVIGKYKFFEKILLFLIGRKRLLVLLLKKWNPDVIIINSPNDLKFLKNFKSKIILVQHGSFEYYLDGTFNKKEVVELIKKRLDKYIFLSPMDMEKFNNFFNLPNNKINSIRHICNVERLKENKIMKRTLITISRLDKFKRIDYIIKAMKKLENFSLMIYGDGEEKEKLEEVIKELKLSNVKLMGKTTNVSKALDEEGIFIMASDFEGYPISCIEALRRGLPIILRNTFSSARDIVQGNGILLNSKWDEDEFVKAVYDVYDNYEEYSKKSLELERRHDIEVIKKEWENIIEELVKE